MLIGNQEDIMTMPLLSCSFGRLEHIACLIFCSKNPFGGEFCIFAGLEEALRFIASFRYSYSFLIAITMPDLVLRMLPISGA